MPLPRAQGGLRSAAVFCLCALFAVLAMGLTLLASGVYRSTAEDSDRNFTHRTALSYLVNQVRRSDVPGGVAIGEFGGGDALVLTEALDGYTYVTVLYCYDGQLRELYMEKGSGLDPEAGTAILPMETMELWTQEGSGALQISLHGADTHLVSITPRCGIAEEGGL